MSYWVARFHNRIISYTPFQLFSYAKHMLHLYKQGERLPKDERERESGEMNEKGRAKEKEREKSEFLDYQIRTDNVPKHLLDTCC